MTGIGRITPLQAFLDSDLEELAAMSADAVAAEAERAGLSRSVVAAPVVQVIAVSRRAAAGPERFTDSARHFGLDPIRDLGKADLSRLKLRGEALEGADLRGANLSYADLSGARLGEADLRDVAALGASLARADLSGADLTNADLTGADLTEANLRDAIVADADFAGAILTGADFTGVDLSAARRVWRGVGEEPPSEFAASADARRVMMRLVDEMLDAAAALPMDSEARIRVQDAHRSFRRRQVHDAAETLDGAIRLLVGGERMAEGALVELIAACAFLSVGDQLNGRFRLDRIDPRLALACPPSLTPSPRLLASLAFAIAGRYARAQAILERDDPT